MDALGHRGNPRVPRSAVERFHQRRLGDLPAEGMLAAASAYDEYFHV
jgi:hypothetical protein